MKYTEVTTMDMYYEYGNNWHLIMLIQMSNFTHKDSGVNLYNWLFI